MGKTAASRPLIVAHRGASYDAPENTLASMRLGMKQGADGIEGDFHITSDGHVVCIHNATTAHSTGGQANKIVAQSTLAELRELDMGSWKDVKYAGEKIPTLAEMLEILPVGKIMLIEIKCGVEILPALFDLLCTSRRPIADCRIICFNEDVIAAIKAQCPAMRCYWLVGYEVDTLTGSKYPIHDRILYTLQKTHADGLDSQADLEVLTPEFVQRLRSAGYELHVWTVDDLNIAQRLIKLGVDSITTNRPEYLSGGIV